MLVIWKHKLRLIDHCLPLSHLCRYRQVASYGAQKDYSPQEESKKASHPDQVTPHIDCLIVEHEEWLAKLSFTVEVYSVAPLDVLVVYKVMGRFLDMPNEGLELHFAHVAHFLQFVNALVEFIKEPLAIIMVITSMWLSILIAISKYILGAFLLTFLA